MLLGIERFAYFYSKYFHSSMLGMGVTDAGLQCCAFNRRHDAVVDIRRVQKGLSLPATSLERPDPGEAFRSERFACVGSLSQCCRRILGGRPPKKTHFPRLVGHTMLPANGSNDQHTSLGTFYR